MSNEQMKQETKKEMGLRLSVARKSLELMTAAFSLVAALAWNDAIQSLFLRLFGTTDGIAAKFVYALIVTLVVVWISVRITRLTQSIEKTQPYERQ